MKLTATITKLPPVDDRPRFMIGYVTDTGVGKPRFLTSLFFSESTARRKRASLQSDFNRGFVPMALKYGP